MSYRRWIAILMLPIVVGIYILRRNVGHEKALANGTFSESEAFWISGVADGVTAYILLMLLAVFVRFIIRKVRRT